MKKSSGEYKTALNLITPSSLIAIIKLKTLRITFLALVLLVSGVVGFSPSIGTLANPENNFSRRIEVPEIPEVPGDQEDLEDSDYPDYPDYSDYPDHTEDQEGLEHPTGTFSVRPVLPENQVIDGVSYFYLAMEPGQEQTISVTIENFIGEYQTIEVAIHLATTDNQGRVNHFGSDELPDATLPHNIENLVSFEPFIQLAPYETVEFWINIRMPTEPYQGVLAGGFTFESVDDMLPAFGMAILLAQGGDVEPQLVLADVSTEVVGGQSVIHAHLRNVAASFAGRLSITTEVRNSVGSLVFTNTRDDIRMAPNSSFTYEVGLNGLQMTSELYEVTFIIEEEEGEDGRSRIWELTWLELQGTGTAATPVVEIEDEVIPEPIQDVEEEQLPEEPTTLDEESLYNVLLLLMIIAGIFVLAIIIVSITRSKKEKTNDFAKLQEQILATLRNDEETSLTLEPEPEIEEIQPFKEEKRLFKEEKQLFKEEKQLFKEEKVEIKSDRASEEKNKIPETKEKAVNGKDKEGKDKEGKEKEGKEKDKEIENKKRELEKKEKEIARIKRELENKEKALRSKEKTIEEKEKELERKEIEKKERVTKKVRTLERKREEWEIDI